MSNTVIKDINMNRDPLTGTPGSHPVGTGLGSASGAAAGAAAGALFGPIGFLVGGAIGAMAGGAAGHAVAEQVDPTGEVEYWRGNYASRPYVDAKRDFDTDYQPAYRYGVLRRNALIDRIWDPTLERDLEAEWAANRASSTLEWNDARSAVRDAWDRADRTYSTYNEADRFHESRFADADYRDSSYLFDDYRNAYRYGTYARAAYPTRTWDDSLETELGNNWDTVKGKSKLTWEKAKAATRDAWHSVERKLTGDDSKKSNNIV